MTDENTFNDLLAAAVAHRDEVTVDYGHRCLADDCCTREERVAERERVRKRAASAATAPIDVVVQTQLVAAPGCTESILSAYNLSRSVRLAHGLEPATQAIEMWGWCRSCPMWRGTCDNGQSVQLLEGDDERIIAGGESDDAGSIGRIETTSGVLRWPCMLARAVSAALNCVPVLDVGT